MVQNYGYALQNGTTTIHCSNTFFYIVVKIFIFILFLLLHYYDTLNWWFYYNLRKWSIRIIRLIKIFLFEWENFVFHHLISKFIVYISCVHTLLCFTKKKTNEYGFAKIEEKQERRSKNDAPTIITARFGCALYSKEMMLETDTHRNNSFIGKRKYCYRKQILKTP